MQTSSDLGTIPNWQDLPFELRSLAEAKRYQEWVFDKVAPYLGNRILEIGAGIGNMSRWLPVRERLVLTELDPQLLRVLTDEFGQKGPLVQVRQYDLFAGDPKPYYAENFDTIVSFNVLEHIEDDRTAFERLCAILRQSQATGPRRLVTFVPAHGWAYGAMDRSFGHFRRYAKRPLAKMLREIAPEAKLKIEHFNLMGLGGWVLNGRVLGKKEIGSGSIAAFEALCPWVKPIDNFLHERLRLPLGQSMLAVLEWRD